MNENEKIKELMSMEVLENILGKERIEALAEESLKEHLDWYFRGNRQALENILFKISYETTVRYINESWDTNLREVCAKKIKDTIEQDEYFSYKMFDDKHEGRKILDEEIENARPYLKLKIRKAMDNLAFKMDGQDIMEYIWEGVIYKLFTEKAKDSLSRVNGEVFMSAGGSEDEGVESE